MGSFFFAPYPLLFRFHRNLEIYLIRIKVMGFFPLFRAVSAALPSFLKFHASISKIAHVYRRIDDEWNEYLMIS